MTLGLNTISNSILDTLSNENLQYLLMGHSARYYNPKKGNTKLIEINLKFTNKFNNPGGEAKYETRRDIIIESIEPILDAYQTIPIINKINMGTQDKALDIANGEITIGIDIFLNSQW